MELICTNDTCKFNKACHYCFYSGTLVINDDGECECYEHYKDDAEYQTIYFKACFTDGGTYKRIAKGRKTVCGDFTLYYEAKDLTPETWCTEEVSGVGAYFKAFQSSEKAEQIKAKIASLDYKNVKNLPYKGDIDEN